LKGAGIEYVLHWLANFGRPWLLVLDNCDDDGVDYPSYCPPSQRGSVIMTTRMTKYRGLGDMQSLNILDREDSILLLLRACNIDPASWKRQKPYAEDAVSLLQQHALSLIHAGSYVSKGYCTLQKWPEFFRRQQTKIMHDQLSHGYDNVYSTFEMSAATLQATNTRESRLALELLGVLSFFHYENIEEDIFVRALDCCKAIEEDEHDNRSASHIVGSSIRSAFDNLTLSSNRQIVGVRANSSTQGVDRNSRSHNGLTDKGEINDLGRWHCNKGRPILGIDSLENYEASRSRLYQLALIDLNTENGTITMHPLLHRWAQERLSQTEQCSMWKKAASILALSTEQYASKEIFTAALCPHLQSCFHSWAQRSARTRISLDIGRILFCFGCQLMQGGNDTEALEIFRSLSKRCTLDVRTNSFKGKILLQVEAECIKDSDKAIAMYEQIIDARAAYLPEDDATLLFAKSNMAAIYARHDRHLEAIPILEQIVENASRLFGHDHPDVHAVRCDLGKAYSHAADYNNAIRVLRRLVVDQAAVEEPRHPTRLVSMKSLAYAYSSSNRPREAIAIWEEILSLESDSCDITSFCSLPDLASDYSDIKDSENAMRIYEEWISRGVDLHDEDTRVHVHNLGQLYFDTDLYEDAVELLEELVEAETQILPIEDESRQFTMHLLACAHKANDELPKAIRLWEILVETRHGVPSSAEHRGAMLEHLRTFQEALGSAYTQLGYHEKALPILENLVRTWKWFEKPTEQARILPIESLARTYNGLERWQDTVTLLKPVFKYAGAFFPPAHPRLLGIMQDLAEAYIELDEEKKAVVLYEKIADLLLPRLELDPEMVTISYPWVPIQNLAVRYSCIAKHQKAVALLERSMAIMRKHLGDTSADDEDYNDFQEVLMDAREQFR